MGWFFFPLPFGYLKVCVEYMYVSACSFITDGTRAHPRAEGSGDEMTYSRVLPKMGNAMFFLAIHFPSAWFSMLPGSGCICTGV